MGSDLIIDDSFRARRFGGIIPLFKKGGQGRFAENIRQLTRMPFPIT
jgi:hypothetical protein